MSKHFDLGGINWVASISVCCESIIKINSSILEAEGRYISDAAWKRIRWQQFNGLLQGFNLAKNCLKESKSE